MLSAAETQPCSVQNQMILGGLATAVVGTAITLLVAKVLKEHASRVYMIGSALTFVAAPLVAFGIGKRAPDHTYQSLFESSLSAEEAAAKLAELHTKQNSLGALISAFKHANATEEKKMAVVHHLPEELRNKALAYQQEAMLSAYFGQAEHRADLLPLVRWCGKNNFGPSILGKAVEPHGLLSECAQELVDSNHHRAYRLLSRDCPLESVMQVMIDTKRVVPPHFLTFHFMVTTPQPDRLLELCPLANKAQRKAIEEALGHSPEGRALLADPTIKAALTQ